MRRALAIDIGASSGRHIVGWTEDGEIRTQEVYRFPNGVHEENGHLCWDTEALVREVKRGIEAARAAYPDIVSLSIDTWGVDYVLLRGDEEVTPVYAYRDSRTEKGIPKVHEIMPFPELYRRTGCQFQPFNSIYQLFADEESGRLAGVTDLLMMPEYLLYKLCGVRAREYTNATTTGLVSAQTGAFDMEIVRALGLPEHLFPALRQPGTVIGEYEGIACVLCATHDTASAVEGIPMDGNQLYISSGTWSLLGVKTEHPLTDAASEAANCSNEGGVGYNRYQKNIMGMWLVNELRRDLCPDAPFGEIVASAQESDCALLVDANAPAFLSPVSMKAAFDAATGNRLRTPGDYFRCAYRSLAASYRDALSELERNTGKHEANVRRLYQSFSKCALYPEQGSGTFESLKKSVEFLYYPSEDQGRILVALMKLYRPIQRIKNCCRLTTEELGGKRVAQYTSLNTLKALLHEPAAGENPPRFRASNSGFMNDLFEGEVFLKLLFQMAPDKIAEKLKNCHELTRDWQSSHTSFVKNNIYIASFVKDESGTSGVFNMWSIYGDAENGCILQFDDSFFDIRNSAKNKKPVELYFISGDTDADYPLYAIEYVQREKERCTLENGEQGDAIQEALKELSMQLASFHDVQRSIQNSESEEESTGIQPRANVRKRKAEQCITSFVSDRLNEIRYLFKDQNYRYENEIRAVISSDHYKVYERNGRNGQSTQITYVEIDRPIERMDVVLGGKIDPIDVQHLTTWMRQTGRVIRITQSKINRE